MTDLVLLFQVRWLGTDMSAYPAERLLGDAKIGGDVTQGNAKHDVRLL